MGNDVKKSMTGKDRRETQLELRGKRIALLC